MGAFRTLIVQTPIVAQVRAMADTWEGGVGMFRRQVLQGDTLYGYISTGMISAEIADQLPYTSYQGEPVEHAGNLEALATEIGATVEQIEALLAYADISDQEWPAACERLGLTLGGYE